MFDVILMMAIVSSKHGVSDEGDSNHEQCYVVRSLCVINTQFTFTRFFIPNFHRISCRRRHQLGLYQPERAVLGLYGTNYHRVKLL